MKTFALALFLIVPILIPGLETKYFEWLTFWPELASFFLGGLLLWQCER